jgi:peptide/nickel transport system substrate-binding protein
MMKKIGWLSLISLMVVALVLAGCTPAATEPSDGQTVKGDVKEQEKPDQPAKEDDDTDEPAVVVPTTGPQYGGTINVAWTSEPVSTDPYYGSEASGQFSYVFETLGIGDWTYDRNVYDFRSAYWPMAVIIGNLAESWEEPDPTTIIYHIRQGIHFHDKPPVNGREMTADDVVYSFQRHMGLGDFTDPSPSGSAMTVLPVESVTATDKWTVEIKLSKLNFNALEMTLFNSYEGGWIVPREVVDMYGDFNDWRNHVGTGPYQLTDHVDGSSWTFTKNPNYWNFDNRYPENRLPYADKVEALVILDIATRMAALRSGKTVAMGGLQTAQAESVARTNPELIPYVALGGSDEQAFNVTKPPFDDIRVRKAMQLAIDNETIARTYYKGNADTTVYGIVGPAAIGFYTPFDEWPEETQKGYSYDPEWAKELLAEAGYPNGFKTVYEMSPAWYAMDVDFAQILKAYWADIGVDVEIKVVERGTLLGNIFNKTYEGMTWGQRGTNYNPLAYLTYMAYSGQDWNMHGGADPEYDAIVDAANAATDRDEMMGLVREADLYYAAQHWQTWTPKYGTTTYIQPWFRGYQAEYSMGGAHFGGMYARAWIDSDLKYELTGER